MPYQHPIIIIGAGISGLALAQGLKSNVPFLTFERDASLTTRPQGYRVRISSACVNALKELLPLDLFQLLQLSSANIKSKSSIPLNFLDALTGQPIKLKYDGPPPPIPPSEEKDAPFNLDRTVLRSVLMS